MQAFFEKNIFFIEFAKFDTIKKIERKIRKGKKRGQNFIEKQKILYYNARDVKIRVFFDI